MSLRDDLRTLQGTVNEAVGHLRDVYRPESTRGELAEAIGQALDVLEADGEDSPQEVGDDGDDD